MNVDTDLATLRDHQHRSTTETTGKEGTAYCAACAALDRVETELARLREHEQEAKNLGYEGMRLRAETAERELVRLQDGMRLTHEFARERLEDGHPGLLDMHLVEDKLRALLADTPEDDQ